MSENGQVFFDPEEFRQSYPQFANITDAVLQNWFAMACLMLDNTKKSQVKDLTERKYLLNLLVCHIGTLSARGDGIVGNLTSATQGKVSTSFSAPANLNWYKQTNCGYLYWQATQKYRGGPRYYGYKCDH